MRHVKLFEEFIIEKEIQLDDILSEYTVNDKGEGKFTVEIDGVEKQFSVIPVPDDIDTYRDIFDDLHYAIKKSDPVKIYRVLEAIIGLPYDFGNLFSTSLSLNNVSSLMLDLTEEQRVLLQSSESEFLKEYFSTLSKSIKDSILKYLINTAQLYAIVIESLFYYMDNGKIDEFFKGMNFDAILDKYQEEVDKVKESLELNIEGPYSDIKNKIKIDQPVDYTFWIAQDKTEQLRWVIQATTSASNLNSEENITGIKGLNFSFSNVISSTDIEKKYLNIPIDDLEEYTRTFLEEKVS